MKKFMVMVLIFVLQMFGCNGSGEQAASIKTETPKLSGPPASSPAVPVFSVYSTWIHPFASISIQASQGGTIEVPSNDGLVKRAWLDIPAGALLANTTITAGSVNSPPALPSGYNFVGVPIDFGPDGTTFQLPAKLTISFTQQELDAAGIHNKSKLTMHSYDKKSGVWSPVHVLSIDTVNNTITVEVRHFSFYALSAFIQVPIFLGTPQMGDIVFCVPKYLYGYLTGWYPGHEGIFTDEQIWQHDGKASDEVKRCGIYNVIEALWSGVQYSYYNFPGAVNSCKVDAKFEGSGEYRGARKPRDFTLTHEQRVAVVEYAKKQVGKSYVQGQSYGVTFGLLAGSLVKGPDSFNCVGLVESSLEYAGVNNGKGLIPDIDESPVLTPAQHYSQTVAAVESNPGPVIDWITLTPDSGAPDAQVLIQVHVTDPDGLVNSIHDVIFITDNGYSERNQALNDMGAEGDLVPYDGICGYITRQLVDPNTPNGPMGITFIVTDMKGKVATKKIYYNVVR